MTTQNGRAFNEWLRAQLKAKKMSQRQLAQQSGVDHSTISRLIRGDRMPSLGHGDQARPRPARAARRRRHAAVPRLVASGSMNPTARVEYALRADELLSEPQVRQIMEYYLAVRMRRYGRTSPADRKPPPARAAPTDRPHARSVARLRQAGRWAPAPASTARRRRHRIRPTRSPAAGTAGNRAVTEHSPRARPGSPSTVRVSGTANAGVWGAGVRLRVGPRRSAAQPC